MSLEEPRFSSHSDRHNLLRDLLVRETSNLRKSVAARIWTQDLARTPEAVADLTDEVLQEVAVRAWARADEYNPALCGYAWLDLFALNVLHEQRRRIYNERRRGLAPGTLCPPAADDPGEDPLEQIPDLRGFEEARIRELLELVPPDDREVLYAHDVLQETSEEIATQLGRTVGAVYMRLSRARNRLRKALRKLDEG